MCMTIPPPRRNSQTTRNIADVRLGELGVWNGAKDLLIRESAITTLRRSPIRALHRPIFLSPTCNKGSNADSGWWHTFVVRNGASGGAVAPHFRDMKVGSGVSITDASILAVSAGTEIPASI